MNEVYVQLKVALIIREASTSLGSEFRHFLDDDGIMPYLTENEYMPYLIGKRSVADAVNKRDADAISESEIVDLARSIKCVMIFVEITTQTETVYGTFERTEWLPIFATRTVPQAVAHIVESIDGMAITRHELITTEEVGIGGFKTVEIHSFESGGAITRVAILIEEDDAHAG